MRGNFGNPEEHSKAGKMAHQKHPGLAEEAGKKGGEATSRKYGPEFYAEIGHEGAEAQPREAKVLGGKNSHKNEQMK